MRSFETSLILANGEILKGTLLYLADKKYRFTSSNLPHVKFEFQRYYFMEGRVKSSKLIVEKWSENFMVEKKYLEQLEIEIAIHNMQPSSSR